MAIRLINSRITESKYKIFNTPTSHTSGSISTTANFDISSLNESNEFTAFTKIGIKATQKSDNKVIFTMNILISSSYKSDINNINEKMYALFLPSIILAHSHINELLNKASIGNILIEQVVLLDMLDQYIKK